MLIISRKGFNKMIITDDKGWVKIIRDENFTTKELKELIKQLEKEYGDKKNLEEIKKEIGNSRKSWNVFYVLYDGDYNNDWQPVGKMQITQYRF